MTKLNLSLLLAVLMVCASAGAQDFEQASAAEQELFRLANQEREKAGVAQLEWNQWLAEAARKHAEEMVRRGELAHRFEGEPGMRERIAATPLRFTASAENLAFAASARELHENWMESAGHRANLLSPKYNALGIAVVRRGKYLYAVQNFAHRVAGFSGNALEDAVAAAVQQVRAETRFPPMRRIDAPHLRRSACEMARQDKLSARQVLSDGHIRSVIAFTEGDPDRFPSHLSQMRRSGPFGRFAVGACFAKSDKYPEGTNWVVIGFY